MNPVICDTYKQALRGLFVTGTSPDLIDRIGKRSDDEPGLKTQIPWVLSCITLRG